ncbi:class I SAM-dependent methyltransferase [Falsiroseomonas sp. CW058]|uniref:class I SAM-dependent methyltransferase n=1 Tax=Falsiroseomonas sp. CW058 TaxID=3388664 RepID=UPI003D319E4D
MRLDELGLRHGTDKASNRHDFLRTYERYLAGMRDSAAAVLEVGVLDGASLRMWADYFPRAAILGIDVKPERAAHRTDRIGVEIGNAGDPKFLAAVAGRHGPFDLILDDGSHLWDHQQLAFRRLFPHLRPGGVFIIEDINTSYVPRYGRDRGALPTTAWMKYYLDFLLSVGTEPNAPTPGEDEVAQIWRNQVAEACAIRKSLILVKRQARAPKADGPGGDAAV